MHIALKGECVRKKNNEWQEGLFRWRMRLKNKLKLQNTTFLNKTGFSTLMVVIQGRARTKPNGKKLFKKYRGKRKHEIGREPALTKIGSPKINVIHMKGGNQKLRALSQNMLNLYNPKNKTYSKVKIKTVTENPANRNFVRRNILTKGAIVDTESGKARITSRPGQTGAINAVLI